MRADLGGAGPGPVYELWFKQILHELRSIADIFGQPVVPEDVMLVVINRLRLLAIKLPETSKADCGY